MQSNTAQNAYKNWKAQNPGLSDGITYQTWLTSAIFGGTGYFQRIMTAQANHDNQLEFVAKLFDIASKPLADAIRNAQAFTTDYVLPAGSKPVALPTTIIDPDMSAAVGDWDQMPPGKHELDVAFNKNTVYTSAWSQHVQVDNTSLI